MLNYGEMIDKNHKQYNSHIHRRGKLEIFALLIADVFIHQRIFEMIGINGYSHLHAHSHLPIITSMTYRDTIGRMLNSVLLTSFRKQSLKMLTCLLITGISCAWFEYLNVGLMCLR